MTPADRTAVDEHLRELETILRHIELAARTPGNGTQRPYRLADARADADRGLAALGRARHMLLGTAAYLGTPGVQGVDHG